MIAKLKGIVDTIGDGWAIIDVGGVGYLVFCSAYTSRKMAIAEACTLLIETHVREDHIHLYGFIDTTEKEWFSLLTTVQGVGTKVALGILSAVPIAQLSPAIASGDKAIVTQAPGVGPKLAARIISELKEKVAKLSINSAIATAAGIAGGASETTAISSTNNLTQDSDNDNINSAVSALVNLGYGKMDAFVAVHRVAKEMETPSLQELISDALKEFGKDKV
ncbi:MAG: Holliday junction branch migration protein RuvA [Alphaproteobacteria bacterium]|nr:Holliday junction branch migration protein RuvA [Alphaproteobacteria bacterium]